MIETHAHLDFPQYDDDRDQVIVRAFEVGVETIINIGIDLETSLKSIELADRYRNIFATVAFHPHHASELNTATMKELERLTSHPKVVAIGEIGLDFFKDLSPREAQIKAFKEQLELAKSVDLPIVIHVRDAHREAFKILSDFIYKTQNRSSGKNDAEQNGAAAHAEKRSGLRGVLHCFSGDEDEAMESINMGFYLAFNGTLTYKNSRAARVLTKLPLDSVLTETDCPFLAPEPMRGKRNEPRLLRRVLEKMVELFPGYSFETIERITSENAKKLFSL